jgi:transcriptional regulator with XRE-family HTH domain
MKPNAIGRALKLTRMFHRQTQIGLAARLCISNSYLSEIESGSKPVSLELLTKYSELFKIPVSTLLVFSERLDERHFTKGLRIKAGDKILRMLEWIAESEEVEKDEEENSASV